jgi:AcrR family transcriptional regulator
MPSVSIRASAPPQRLVRRQQELVERLIDVFLHEGFMELSIDDMARRLRCSKTTIYGVAESKQQVIAVVVRGFFRRATDRVEQQIQAVDAASTERIRAYLMAIAAELAPASPEFFADLDAYAPTREIYLENTRIAGERLQGIILECVPAASHSEALFIGSVAASVMNAIHRGEIESVAGLDDSAAYRALARLIVAGVEASATAPDDVPRRVALMPPQDFATQSRSDR